MVSITKFLSRRRRRLTTPKTGKANKRAKKNEVASPRYKTRKEEHTTKSNTGIDKNDSSVSSTDSVSSCGDHASSAAYMCGQDNSIAGHHNSKEVDSAPNVKEIDIDQGYRMQLEQDEQKRKEFERKQAVRQHSACREVEEHHEETNSNSKKHYMIPFAMENHQQNNANAQSLSSFHSLGPNSNAVNPNTVATGLPPLSPRNRDGPFVHPSSATVGTPSNSHFLRIPSAASSSLMHSSNADMTIVDLQSTIDFLTTKLQQSESQVLCLQEQNGKLQKLFVEEQQQVVATKPTPQKIVTANSIDAMATSLASPCSLMLPTKTIQATVEARKDSLATTASTTSSMLNTVGQRLRKQLWVDTASPMSGGLLGCGGAFPTSLPNSPWKRDKDLDSPSLFSDSPSLFSTSPNKTAFTAESASLLVPPKEPEPSQTNPQVFTYDDALYQKMTSYKSQLSMLEHEKRDMQRQLMHLQVQNQVQHDTMASLEHHLQTLHLQERVTTSSVVPKTDASNASASKKKKKSKPHDPQQQRQSVLNNTPVPSPTKECEPVVQPQQPVKNDRPTKPQAQQNMQQDPSEHPQTKKSNFRTRPPTPRPQASTRPEPVMDPEMQDQVDEIVAALSQARSTASRRPKSSKRRVSAASRARGSRASSGFVRPVPTTTSSMTTSSTANRRQLAAASQATSNKYSSAIRAGSFTPSRSYSGDKEDTEWQQQQQLRMSDLQEELQQEEQLAQQRLHQELLQHDVTQPSQSSPVASDIFLESGRDSPACSRKILL